ncbi:heat-inducible transcriptional repressor HrcA [Leptolyngbya sp. FACHB-261]|uniref:heat-inducible transcriptional repressor HrcA n=1 Tax=Leptolyngbya sp. FACHB-261 TaxID=2692806 RepID=UPI00168833E6|nr:heat-inducible transcriptional repressor HrcA [Leptolyngbya sp. FACHB-261]MBD2100646.1 heat-inducible transcriptional repressor HrcA [Leptolyngbya sp. FACHB-261]
MKVKLTSRQQRILWATIQRYVATAEPVGSKVLVDEYDFGVSPATVRNTMSVLERSGLLYQPHTSAGRVPSDSGYRVYVDELITPRGTLVQDLESYLAQRLGSTNGPLSEFDRSPNLEALLRGAAQLLATVSGCIALITIPQPHTVAIRHLQLVLVAERRVMVVVVLDSYQTYSVLLDLPTDFCDEASSTQDNSDLDLEHELQILTNFLNTHLRGCSLSELVALDRFDLSQEFHRYSEFLRHLLALLIRHGNTPRVGRILISGVAEVLRQPEFSERQQVQALVQLLEEEQEQLWPLICEWSDSLGLPQIDTSEPNGVELNQRQGMMPRVSVRIGSENPLEPIQNCTLICSAYCLDRVPVGSVGVLGPTRLPYERAIASVQVTANYLSNAIGQSA